MHKRIDTGLAAPGLSSGLGNEVKASNDSLHDTKELDQANALFSLLENRYQRKVAPSSILSYHSADSPVFTIAADA